MNKKSLTEAAKQWDDYDNAQAAFIAGAKWMEDNRWIDTSQLLPDIGEYVVLFHNKNGVLYNFCYEGEGEFYDNLYDNTYFATPDEISHWMPFPESPKN